MRAKGSRWRAPTSFIGIKRTCRIWWTFQTMRLRSHLWSRSSIKIAVNHWSTNGRIKGCASLRITLAISHRQKSYSQSVITLSDIRSNQINFLTRAASNLTPLIKCLWPMLVPTSVPNWTKTAKISLISSSMQLIVRVKLALKMWIHISYNHSNNNSGVISRALSTQTAHNNQMRFKMWETFIKGPWC